MADNPLIKKLKLKPGQRAALLYAPEGYAETLQPLPDGVALHTSLEGDYEWVQLFVHTRAELEARFPQVLPALRPESLLWLTFPKGSSKVQTDLTRDQGWERVAEAGLKWTSLVSIDATWSAFSLRPYRPGEPRQSFR